MLYAIGKGRYDKEYGALWKALVPLSGPARTVQGELVRAIDRLASECYRNGNGNWDRGFRSCVDFLRKHLTADEVFGGRRLARIRKDLDEIGKIGNGTRLFGAPQGEDPYDRITDAVVEWCRRRTDPIPHARNPRLKR